MKRRYRLLIVICLVFLLMLIRSYGPILFYDPFIDYFKGAYLKGKLPEFKMVKLFSYLTIRFILNSLVSLIIIYAIFLKKESLLFAAKIYGVVFLVFTFFYYFHLRMEFPSGYLSAFYIRRILIHPILLLVLVPTFYFQRRMKA